MPQDDTLVANQEFVELRGQIKLLAAERATVAVGTSDLLHQICQIGFQRDGSISVQCPYFPGHQGILSSPSQDPDATGPITYNLREAGKLTSHLVKLNHHPDGNVHFSQDGKILTLVRRKTFDLSTTIGHVFQLHTYFPDAFEPLKQTKAGRAYLPFVFQPNLPKAVTVWGEWRRRRDMEANLQPSGGIAGPLTDIQNRKTGVVSKVFFLGQPAGFAFPDNLLLIGVHSTQELSTVVEPTMILVGGFDPHEVKQPGIPSRQTGLLCWLYPHRPTEESRQLLGSVDFGADANS